MVRTNKEKFAEIHLRGSRERKNCKCSGPEYYLLHEMAPLINGWIEKGWILHWQEMGKTHASGHDIFFSKKGLSQRTFDKSTGNFLIVTIVSGFSFLPLTWN